jgi:hypothetical protein
MALTTRYAACACGQVRCRSLGEPILSAVCYCDDCQRGAEQIEALPGAAAFREADGGTPYLTWRDDRFACVEGAGFLTDYRINDGAPTRRVVASCCNSAIYLKFGPGHWISAYRMRFDGDPPPLEMRTQTRFRHSDMPLPADMPSYTGFPLALFAKLMGARIAMFFRR